MVEIKNNVIYCQLKNTSYWLKVNEYGHLEHVYYGPKIPIQSVDALSIKRHVSYGSSVTLGHEYSLDQQHLEIGFVGKGDFRPSSYEVDGSVSHLRVVNTFVNESVDYPTDFFSPRLNESAKQVVVELVDDYHPVKLTLYYTLYPELDIVLRHAKVVNESEQEVILNKLMSASFDVKHTGFEVITLNGTWGKEAQIKKDKVSSGTLVHQSITGASSSLTNPGLLLEKEGLCYGLNLIYSGNHYNSVTAHYDGSTRIMMGINPETFRWHLNKNESFESPLVLMSSGTSQTEVSQRFHRFIREQIIPKAPFEKPVTYNHWEGTFFDYDHKKLVGFAKKAADLGIDLFVIDDGWFGHRNQDNSSLGDYTVNPKKFPFGLKSCIDEIRQLGLKVGIWVEPEMINEDSDLYRTHPDWVMGQPNHLRAKGRNQWVLDLCQTEVQDYIVDQVSRVIDEYGVDYIKWDMNRHHSDQYSIGLNHQKELDVRFQKALVSILKRIFNPRPHVFLEMCSSGGNRFDLGMLSVAQQIWTSDNTDAMDRLRIQEGTALFYPLSCISNHVSGKINTQTLRKTSLSTRFNVACFGALGYELDLNLCSKAELLEMKEQIQFYKRYKEIILKGDFSVIKPWVDERHQWQVKFNNEVIVGLFSLINYGLQPRERLRVTDLEDETFYTVASKPQKLNLERFGELLKHVTPLPIHPYGAIMNTISHYQTMDDGQFETIASGALLKQGITLNDLYLGTGYHPDLRLWGDFGSTLYTIKELAHEKE